MGIGNRIKEARKSMGLTQEELAKLVGVTKGAIANYENGTSHPKESILYKLIDVFGCDANYLFQDMIHVRKPSSATPQNEAALLDLYRQLNGEGQQRVIDYTEDLVSSGRYSEKNDHSEMVEGA